VKEQAKRLLEMVTDEESRRHERRALAELAVERQKELEDREDSERALNGEDTPQNTETAEDLIQGVGKAFKELPGNTNCMHLHIRFHSVDLYLSFSFSFSFSI